MKQPLILMVSLFIFGFVSPAAHAQTASSTKAQWGQIVYPLAGNVRSEQGTFLCWYRIDVPTNDKPGTWYQPQSLWYRYQVARMMLNQENYILFYVKAVHHQGRLQTLNRLPGDMWPIVDKRSTKWKQDELHVIGYTWNRQGKHALWTDGELVGSQKSSTPSLGLGSIDMEHAELILGRHVGSNDNGSAITLLGVHLLGKPLDAKIMKQAKASPKAMFKPCASTLLLDTFENDDFMPDGKRQTHAQAISHFSGEVGGTPTANTQFIRTSRGRGLQLYVKR